MIQPDFIPMTKNGFQKIEQEIEDLKKNRPTLIKALADARALGDLSENAEYSSAKRDLRRMEGRLRYLQRQLSLAKIVENDNLNEIDLGRKVDLEFLDDDFSTTYEIVGKHEADIADGKLSYRSPLGQAIMGHHIGDVVWVVAPDEKYQVKVVSIS